MDTVKREGGMRMSEDAAIDEIRALVPDYETDESAVGENRTASPPDDADQDWTEVHPNGSREWRGIDR